MNEPMLIKIITVVGARPNLMKAAPVIEANREDNENGVGEAIRHLFVHTGRHYDPLMSDQFLAELNLPKPRLPTEF